MSLHRAFAFICVYLCASVAGVLLWRLLVLDAAPEIGEVRAILPPIAKEARPMPTKTELIWDGKYDAKGNRVAPLRVTQPFQTVETINESAQERGRSLFQLAEQDKPWRNRLIWGDKKFVLPSLLPEFAGKVDLIYIDPPFDTGADFSFTANIPDADDEDEDDLAFTKQPSLIEQKAYRDTWGRGLDSYLQWFYETALLLRELLADNGSVYVHLDWHVGHYAKVVLDEVFGMENCQGEVVWKRASTVKGNFGQGSKLWSPNTESIFPYSQGPNCTFHPVFTESRINNATLCRGRNTGIADEGL